MTDVQRPIARRRRDRFCRLGGGGVFAAAMAASITAGCRRTPSGYAPICTGGRAVSVRAPTTPIGFDAPFVVTATALCPEARGGRITWRQVSGARVRDLASDDAGFTLRARTPALTDTVGANLPWGIVPLSPRTRGEVVLAAIWRDPRGREERHEVRVAAAPRSRGLPNTPVGARVYLGGSGWRVDTRPGNSAAAAEVAGDAVSITSVTSFLPDVAGDFHLRDGAGRALALRAARYDETPLDCGRSDCHQAITDATAASPMTSVLARGLSPLPGGHSGHAPAFGPGYPDCALACHAVGEPGLSDGGFAHVATAFGITAADLSARRWDQLPRSLRRLGGVGCLACHGPGALPEASARWSILRPGVCATCHDAPPRYGHVVAWGGTAMARADRDPRAASDRACVRCHTTWGFLASLSDDKVDRRPSSFSDVATDLGGISCAACHAAHDHARAAPLPAPASIGAPVTVQALLRTPPPPEILGDVSAVPGKSRVCLGCHAPDPGDAAPTASAAALWLGRGGIDPASGDPLGGPAPHATVAGGCAGCHNGGPAELKRGAGHGFSAGTKICSSCHAQAFPPSDLRARALRLWTKHQGAPRSAAPATGAGPGGPMETTRPPHADRPQVYSRLSHEPDRTPVARALWNLALVIEDPAAETHNAPYARALLNAAERALNSANSNSPRRHE